MSPQEPTPSPEHTNPAGQIMCQSLADCTFTQPDRWFIAVDKLLADLALAGYELVNQVGTVREFGVTKGLPGIGDALTRASAAQQRVVNAEQNLVEAYAGRAAAHAGEEAGKAFAAGLSRSDNNWLTRMLENTNTVCVQLPEPDEHGCWYIDGTNDWLVHTGANGKRVFFETSVDLYEFAPDHAGNVAAALLAAKAKVEASE